MQQRQPKVIDADEALELDETVDFDAVARRLLAAAPKPQGDVKAPSKKPARRV